MHKARNDNFIAILIFSKTADFCGYCITAQLVIDNFVDYIVKVHHQFNVKDLANGQI